MGMSMKKYDVRALSIIQPWADAIIHHGKNVENRSWSTDRRGYVAIHASLKKDKELFLYLKNEFRISLEIEKTSFGVIIGFAKIIEVISDETVTRNTKKWFSGDYGLVLDEVIPLKEPVLAKGALGFWRVENRILKRCLGQLSLKNQTKILNGLY